MRILGKKNAQSSAKAKDKAINDMLKESFRETRDKMKLLLLGAGESGKSTIFKQTKILYGQPPTNNERMLYTDVVHNNTTSAWKILLNQAENWDLVDKIKDQASMTKIRSLPECSKVDRESGNAMKSLWEDEVVKQVWARRAEYEVMDSLAYFVDNLDRIMKPDYLATSQDYLHTRVRTTEVATAEYRVQGTDFEWFDVGGQRNQRRKWIHCFSDVTAVIYVVALSEYDQMLYEDTTTNRMKEALDLFDDVARLEHFNKSSIIVFLNKYDLFLHKIITKPIEQQEMWKDYNGSTDPEECMGYFKAKFQNIANDLGKTVYFHTTTATNTSNIGFVVNACQDIILHQNIALSGLC